MSFERSLRLLATFSALKLKIDIQTFDTRFLIQKNVYFLQEFGADFGYAFGMYIRGPYSPALARDAYALQELEYEENDIRSVSVNTDAIARFRRFMENVDQLVSGGKSRIYWLELLASLHFLCKYGYPKVEKLADARNRSKLAQFGDDLKTAYMVLKRHKII